MRVRSYFQMSKADLIQLYRVRSLEPGVGRIEILGGVAIVVAKNPNSAPPSLNSQKARSELVTPLVWSSENTIIAPVQYTYINTSTSYTAETARSLPID